MGRGNLTKSPENSAEIERIIAKIEQVCFFSIDFAFIAFEQKLNKPNILSSFSKIIFLRFCGSDFYYLF